MPLFEFECECGAVFEELLSESQPEFVCRNCKGTAKLKISKPSVLMGAPEGTTITPNEIDRRVGELSEKRWKSIESFKRKQKEAQERLGTSHLTKRGDEYTPMPAEEVKLRERVKKIMIDGERVNKDIGVAKRKEAK